MELFRSLHFVPGNRRDMLQKARSFDADVLIADLEDSVPVAEKVAARDIVQEMAPNLSGRGQKIMVRLNPLDTGLTVDELAAVTGHHLYGISVGKVESPWHIQEYDRLVGILESREGMEPGHIKIIPWIESAKGVMRALDIAIASPRVVALGFGAEDYAKDVEVQRTESGEEVYLPRSMIPVIAKAADIVALDAVYVQFRDIEGLRKDAEVGLRLGYKGKFSIHPAQLEIINTVFSPWPEDVEYARRVVQAWDQAQAEGKGACSLDGNMIDIPVVERARNLLALAEEIAKRH